MLIQSGYKTELRLNNKQRTACLKHAGAARFAYNWGMNQKKMAMEVKDKIPNAIELHRRLNALKKSDFGWRGRLWLRTCRFERNQPQ